MLNKISFNMPQSIVQPVLASVAENSIAASFAKSSYSLQSLNSIASTQQNVLWWVVLGLAMLACGEDGPPSSNTPVANDPEQDNVPENKDLCPDAGGLSISGCPIGTSPEHPTPPVDTEGDGIPDDQDECSDDYHPSLDSEANGCAPVEVIDTDVPDAGPTPAMPDPRPQSSWQLLTGESSVMSREENPICPHLASNEQQAVLGWQEGSHFYTSRVAATPLATGEIEDEGEVANAQVNACQLTRALAVNAAGQTAVLTAQLVDENWVELFIHFNNADGSNTAQEKIAKLPYPHLGEEQRDTFASIAALPNNQFVVVWADRDQMLANIVNADGTLASEEPIQVSRPIDVLQMSNPDVLATADGFKVIWQEGNTPFGNVALASFNLNGEKLGEDKILNDAESLARWPVLTGSGQTTSSAWVLPVGGSVQTISEAGAEQLFSFAPQNEVAGDVAAYYAPQLLLDDQDRLTLAWVEQYRDATAKLRLYSHSEASQLPEDATTIGTQVSNVPADSKAALTQQGETVLLAYPVLQPANALMLRSFQWTNLGGRESAAQP